MTAKTETATETTTRCRWFLYCENPATATEPHPLLGNVPICPRCAGWLARMRAKT